jgi:orotate phosphoribosyltransferase
MVAPWPEIPLTAAANTRQPRAINQEHFHAQGQLPRGSHPLLLDDTWTTGGHAQSAVLALRAVGAAHVSLLVVARWVKEDFGDNAAFLRGLADRDYDPEICPWTGGDCPKA